MPTMTVEAIANETTTSASVKAALPECLANQEGTAQACWHKPASSIALPQADTNPELTSTDG